MAPSFDGDNKIRLYLLGTLSEQERSQFEERLMTDDEFFKQLLVIEDELTDDYVHGLLSQADRERFEAHFLSTPDRRRQLSFARALDLYVSKANRPDVAQPGDSASWWSSLLSFFRSGNPALSLAFVAAALLLVAGGAWLVFKVLQAEQAPAEIRVDQKGSEPAPSPGTPTPQPAPQDRVAEDRPPAPGPTQAGSPQPAPPERRPSAPLRIAAIVTQGGVRSSGETIRVAPEPGEKAVRVRLDFGEGAYKSYRAEIKNIDDRASKLPPQDGLKGVNVNSHKAVFLRIPLDRYPPGDYDVTLMGRNAKGELEEVGSYSFRVLPVK